MLRGNLEKAKNAYREFRREAGPKSKSILLKVPDDREATGVTHGDITKARKPLEEQ